VRENVTLKISSILDHPSQLTVCQEARLVAVRGLDHLPVARSRRKAVTKLLAVLAVLGIVGCALEKSQAQADPVTICCISVRSGAAVPAGCQVPISSVTDGVATANLSFCPPKEDGGSPVGPGQDQR
jgi:hypothetical protein